MITDPYQGQPAELLFTARDNRGRDGSFQYYKARNGMVFIDHAPANLGDYYELGFQPIPEDEVGLAKVAQDERFKIDQLRRFITGGKYLEIGTWIGMAAYSAKEAGFDVTALEMSQECVDLMQRSGLRAIQNDDPAAWLRDTEETFDVIAMWHSIEHVPEPWTVLELAMKRLRPGGVMLVATPNPESAQAREHREKWFHLDAPRHLHLLPVSMVEEIGRANGLELIDKTTDDRLGLHLDRQGWEWPFLKHTLKSPVGRERLSWFAAVYGALTSRKHRRGDNDGAAYTIIMGRPAQA